MSDRRLLVLGFDALDPDLLTQWMNEGLMPNFARLMQESAWTKVHNPRGLDSGSVWPTFYHGKLPGRHPQHDATRCFDPETYETRTFHPEELHEDYIWDHLSKQGKRVCVVDMNYTFLPDSINGIVVHDWGTHCPAEPGSKLQFKTYPASLEAEIKRQFGGDPLGGHLCDDLEPRSRAELADFTDKLITRIHKRTAMAEVLWAKEPWDFFSLCYSEAHCIGHHAWHLHDSEHPDHDADLAEELGNPMQRVYVELDAQLGALRRLVGEDVVTFAYCSHGMGPNVSATRLLDKILTRLEGGQLKDKTKGAEGKMRGAWRSLPPGVKKKFEPLKRAVWKTVVKSAYQGNFAERKCFEVIATDAIGGVRVNLAGREAQGVVQPGEDYEQVLDQVTRDLKEVVNLDTEELLVSEVLRTDDLYGGPYRRLLPDLLVEWNRAGKHAPIRSVFSEKIGVVEHDAQPPRTGDHKPDGLFFCTGPGVRHGRLNEAMNVADMAPTFAQILRVPMAGADGSPISALVGETVG